MAIQQYSPINAAYQQARYGAQAGVGRLQGAASDIIGRVATPRNLRLAGIGSKALGAAAIPIAAGMEYYDRKNKGEDDLRAATGTAASVGGGLAGAAGGAAAGAALGSFVPVVGTAIGGIVGGIAGYMGGSAAGGAASDFANDGLRGRYEGYDNSTTALAKSLADRDNAIASGDPMKAATAYAATNEIAKKRRMEGLTQTSGMQNLAAVGQGVQDSMEKGNLGQQGTQTNTASALPSYSNTGLEDLDRSDPEYRTEMAARRVNDMQRGNAQFQQGLLERGGRFATGQQQIMEGTRTRNSVLQQYLAGSQQGNTQALISAYNQRY